MKDMNRVTLMGRLGNDPEFRQTPGGHKLCKFSLATDKNWHRITIWGNAGERAQKDLKKGDQVFLDGSLSIQSYVDREGKRRRSVDVNVNSYQLVVAKVASLEAEEEEVEDLEELSLEDGKESALTHNVQLEESLPAEMH